MQSTHEQAHGLMGARNKLPVFENEPKLSEGARNAERDHVFGPTILLSRTSKQQC